MNLNEITVLVWDEPANFHSQETQRSFGSNKIFKELIQFNSLDEFKIKIEFVKDEEKLVFCCHVKMSDLSLYEEFRNSGIIEKFNIPVVHYLSSSPEVATLKFREKFGENEKIQYYNGGVTVKHEGEHGLGRQVIEIIYRNPLSWARAHFQREG